MVVLFSLYQLRGSYTDFVVGIECSVIFVSCSVYFTSVWFI